MRTGEGVGGDGKVGGAEIRLEMAVKMLDEMALLKRKENGWCGPEVGGVELES